MSQIYRTRRAGRTAPAAQKAQAASGPSLRELAAGAAPTPEQMGRRVDLPGEIREKMEASFGADFSGVKLYESQTVADAGAEAMTQGQNIAFAPGRLDLTGTAGQALLGHELSHVVSQARGESAGQGFLADPGLEAQADREGMLAAQGESVYSGPVSPVGVSSAATASGPMQAKKYQDEAEIMLERRGKDTSAAADMGYFDRKRLAKEYRSENERRRSAGLVDADAFNGRGPESLRPTASIGLDAASSMGKRKYQNQELADDIEASLRAQGLVQGSDGLANASGTHSARGLSIIRSLRATVTLATEAGMEESEIRDMVQGMSAGGLSANKTDPNTGERRQATPEEIAAGDEHFDTSVRKLKEVYYQKLKRLQAKYGNTLGHLHPEDIDWDEFGQDTSHLQDTAQLLEFMPELFDEDDPKDVDYMNLTHYFMQASNMISAYGNSAEDRVKGRDSQFADDTYYWFRKRVQDDDDKVLATMPEDIPAGESPVMGPKELQRYRKNVISRFGNDPRRGGDFKDADPASTHDFLEEAAARSGIEDKAPKSISEYKERKRRGGKKT